MDKSCKAYFVLLLVALMCKEILTNGSDYEESHEDSNSDYVLVQDEDIKVTKKKTEKPHDEPKIPNLNIQIVMKDPPERNDDQPQKPLPLPTAPPMTATSPSSKSKCDIDKKESEAILKDAKNIVDSVAENILKQADQLFYSMADFPTANNDVWESPREPQSQYASSSAKYLLNFAFALVVIVISALFLHQELK